MKKLLIGLVVLALGGSAGADVFKAKLGERLAIPIKMALDTTGRAHTPDSVEVTTYQQGATAATKFRSYTYAQSTASTGWFDTTNNGGRAAMWLNTYVDSLGSSPTSKIIGLNVTMFYQTVPFEQTHLIEVGSYNFDSTAYNGAGRAIHDSTVGLSTLVDTLPEAVWFFDSANAAGFAATDMGRQLTKDVTATTDTLAAARAVWRVNLSAYATDTFPKAGKLLYLAGDSTGFLNQYDMWNVQFGGDTSVHLSAATPPQVWKAGSIADSLNNPSYIGNVWTIAGSTDTTHNVGSTEAQRLRNIFRSSTGAPMYLTLLDIGGAAGSNGAMYVHNSSGPGVKFETSNSSWPAGYIYNSSTGSASGLLVEGATNGTALELRGFGSGSAIKATASGSGNGIQATSSTGYGLYLNSNSSDGLFARGGGSSGFGAKFTGSGSGAGLGAIGGTTGFAGSFISSGNYGIFTQGAAAGMYNYSPSGTGLVADGNIGLQAISAGTTAGIVGVVDSVAGVGSSGSSGSDTVAILALAENHPDAFYGPTNSGGLTYQITLYVIDSGANPDDSLQSIYVSLADNNGALTSWGKTDQTGKVILAADAGTYTIRAFHPPYSFPVKTMVVSTDTTTQLYGYNSVTGSLCRVWGSIVDWGLTAKPDVQLTFTFPYPVNPSDSSIMIERTIPVMTDEDGLFSVDLIRSSVLQNKKWQVTIDYPSVSPLKREFSVPDTTSYRLTW